MINNSYHVFFNSFANKSKLDIIIALREKPLNVKEIVKRTRQEQSAVSHNLMKLAKCHILDVRRKGKERIYSLNKETISPLFEMAEKHVKNNCNGKCFCKDKCNRRLK